MIYILRVNSNNNYVKSLIIASPIFLVAREGLEPPTRGL